MEVPHVCLCQKTWEYQYLQIVENVLVQSARRRTRGYRNVETFITMTYLLAAPTEEIIKFT